MAPAYDEFEEKDKRRRRSSSDTVTLLPRIRRNRRTSVCVIAIIVLALYYLLKLSTSGWESPLDLVEFDDQDQFAPYYQYQPVLGPENNREGKAELPSIRFPHLYASLSTSSAAGLRTWNQNVLFLAADLKAAKRLAVTACEMSKRDRAQVHFAILGDSSTVGDDFQTYSGIGPDGDCKLTFHDATTLTQLTLPLLGKAVKYALVHLHRFLHPQVMFVDTENENQVVSKAIKDAANQLGIPMVELPNSAAENLRWMTRLSAQSLRAWNRPKVEIYIRCDKHHGNLERLLKSLRNADYFGIMPTRLTIEVGTSSPLHPFTQEFIENFNWPSRDRVGIRYPISFPGEDSLSQAVHHIQSFYPVDRDTSILFLDPNVELSPYYFHWLHYATLEYIYSAYPFNADPDGLYGISLTTPKAYINGTEPFDPDITKAGPYLYGAPSTEAVLFFPQSWKKFYRYFQWRMQGIITQKMLGQSATESISPSAAKSSNNPTEPIPPSSLPGRNENNPDLLLGETKKHEDEDDKLLTGTTKQNEDDKLLTGATKLNQRSDPPASPPQRNFTLLKITPSSEFASSWHLYLTEYTQIQGGVMLYPNFGLTDDAMALAICHSERPLEANYKMGAKKNPGLNEQRLIQSMTLLDSLPGWNLPVWQNLPIRNIAGETSTDYGLESDAHKYKSQISNSCPDEESQDLMPVADLLCSDMA